MQAIKTDQDAAIEFFTARFKTIEAVRDAIAFKIPDGIDLQVVVEDPYLDNEDCPISSCD